ncbi:hypothetical protein BaRGS_00009515 [Batillaria attramentaria]|uniref:Uncharacterized protein n=1 Tax=Batillaria attramentaria TaxID=370345 RepID=A0ABD0LIJ7_9CAEN
MNPPRTPTQCGDRRFISAAEWVKIAKPCPQRPTEASKCIGIKLSIMPVAPSSRWANIQPVVELSSQHGFYGAFNKREADGDRTEEYYCSRSGEWRERGKGEACTEYSVLLKRRLRRNPFLLA